MMLAMRFEADVTQDDHLVIASRLLEGAFENRDRVLAIAGEPFLVGAHDTLRRAKQTLAIGIVPRPAQQRAHGRFGFLAGRLGGDGVAFIRLVVGKPLSEIEFHRVPFTSFW